MSYSAFGISPFQREVGSSNDNCSHFGRFACWPRHKGAAATGQRLVGQIPEDGSAAGRLSHNEHCARLVSNAAYVTRAPMDTNWRQRTPIETIRHHWTPLVDTRDDQETGEALSQDFWSRQSHVQEARTNYHGNLRQKWFILSDYESRRFGNQAVCELQPKRPLFSHFG